uniref:Uncharacterized protein n=1 Tax=Knipowitschia caucasica TaxID=637954 RepID=A0AAV2JTJ2_KNICA
MAMDAAGMMSTSYHHHHHQHQHQHQHNDGDYYPRKFGPKPDVVPSGVTERKVGPLDKPDMVSVDVLNLREPDVPNVHRKKLEHDTYVLGTIHPFRKSHRSIFGKLKQELSLVASDRRSWRILLFGALNLLCTGCLLMCRSKSRGSAPTSFSFRGSSEAAQRQLRGSSEAAQRQLRGSSEAAQRQLRGSSEAAQRQLRGSPEAACCAVPDEVLRDPSLRKGTTSNPTPLSCAGVGCRTDRKHRTAIERPREPTPPSIPGPASYWQPPTQTAAHQDKVTQADGL